MKKVILVLVAFLLMVGCARSDEMALGIYKDRRYTNQAFALDFEIDEAYSFLTKEELELVNKETHEASKDPETAKYHNKVMDISSKEKVSMIAYVDSTPDLYKNADAEANAFLDFLTESRIAYKLEKGNTEINGEEYLRLSLQFDFGQRQEVLFRVADDKLIQIQITFADEYVSVMEDLVKMIDSNE